MAKRDENDALRVEYNRLKANLSNMEQARKVMQRVMSEPLVANIFGKIRKDERDMTESLVSTAKADIEKVQAGVLARRSILGYLEHAYETDIEEATRCLKEFRARNELFIQAMDAEDSKNDDLHEKYPLTATGTNDK